MTTAPISALLLLADGRLPTGGHAHSGGLEEAVAGGRVLDVISLASWLSGRLATTGRVDAALATATLIAPSGARVLDAEAAARCPSSALRKASRTQGRGLLRAGQRMWPTPLLDELFGWRDDGVMWPVALGAVGSVIGAGPYNVAVVAAQGSVSGPAWAATRLLGLDPFAVARCLADLAPQVEAVAEAAVGASKAPDDQLDAYGAPLSEIGAQLHAAWEVRLFVLNHDMPYDHDIRHHHHDRPADAPPSKRPTKPLRIGVGGPVGSGKTALLAALCRTLSGHLSVAVVTNDIYTTEDAQILRHAAVLPDERIVAVETGCCPHTAIRDDISANLDAVEGLEARFSDLDLVMVESGGDNLTATFSYGLIDYQIFVIDVAGGDKVPRKGGPGITASDLLVINKTDLAALVGADLEVMARDARAARGARPVTFTSLVKDPGAAEVARWVESRLACEPAPS